MMEVGEGGGGRTEALMNTSIERFFTAGLSAAGHLGESRRSLFYIE